MNSRIFCAFLLLFAYGLRAQLALNPGESYVHHFTTVNFSTPLSGLPQTGGYGLTIYSVLPGTIVQVEMWEGLLAGAPAHTTLHTNFPTSTNFPNIWNDREGTLRMTTLTGGITFRDLHLSVFADTFGGPETDGNYSSTIPFPSGLPRLSIERMANNVKVSWWTNGSTGYVLESATQVAASPWESVTNAPVLTDNQNVVVLGSGDPARFFRLRK